MGPGREVRKISPAFGPALRLAERVFAEGRVGVFSLIRAHALRPWLEGNLAGCPGLELLALGLLEGGMGLFVLHPRPWQPAQGCLPQQRHGQRPTSGGVCLQMGFALAGGGVRTSGERGKDTTF